MSRGIRHKFDASTDPSLGLVRRKVASWLGLILLAFNLLAGSGFTAQASENSSPAFGQELLGDRIVVCTAAGMVVMDRDGHVLDTNGNSGHIDACVFCLPLMHSGAGAPAAEVGLVLPVLSSAEQAFLDSYRLPDLRQVHNPHPARAPPAFS
jgi:hypothetical protein